MRITADQVHSQPPDSHLQHFLEALWRAVADETRGRLQVKVHPSHEHLRSRPELAAPREIGREFWRALPADVQETVNRNVKKFVAAQRENVRRVNAELERDLAARGMTFNTADTSTFRSRLTSGFYARWKAQLGAIAWELLERDVGRRL